VTEATGFPPVLDYNDYNTPIGPSSQFQETQKGNNGRLRVSSMNAFLGKNIMTPDGEGVKGRKLRILFNTTALRTIWEGNKAVGVEYLQDDEIKRVFAKKGVIVCAGLQSSFFLLHSGVGPRNVLEPLGIPVIFDNPNVGQGLADQPSLVMAFTANPDDFPVNSLTLFKQISWFPDPIGDQNIRQLRLAFANPIPGLMVAVFDLVQPKSRGSLTINSSNPLDPPVIDFGDFTNLSDLNLFKRGLQTYVKNINITLHARDSDYELVDPNPLILDNDAAVIEFIKSRVSSNQSFQSHCRMVAGRTVDEAIQNGGVVDSTGYVYGVRNLIVADNSVAPLCMDGSSMASAYLIPWNIARMLIKARK
jgi:choline dehydrogenase-like flavoprotein